MQSNEILLNLSIKCWNSAFNAQGLRVIVVVVHVGGATKIYMCNVSGGAQEKRKDRLKLSIPPKLMEKLVWVPVCYFAL
jgi:hypothetical protein